MWYQYNSLAPFSVPKGSLPPATPGWGLEGSHPGSAKQSIAISTSLSISVAVTCGNLYQPHWSSVEHLGH